MMTGQMAQIETVLSALAPVGLSLALGNQYIDFLRKRYMGQYIREDGPQSHQSKAGTPTAGGVLILGSFLFAVLVLAVIKGMAFLTVPVLLVTGVTLGFGLLGFVDDYLKISKKKNKGVSGYTKLAVQITAGLLVGWFAMQAAPAGDVSFFGLFSFQLGWLYPVFAAFVITATSNAVNLTDGLDGLASGTSLMTFMTLGMLLMVSGQANLAMLALALAGAALGFLMFNRHPARIFMGDTGSLALGGALGALVVLAHLEFWVVLLGVVFVLEALSVVLQVLSFKTTGKRIFRMSPLHHHFELGGWKETQVVYSFVTFQFFCCMLAVFLYNGGV
ncbi:MAG: Phospho-N-acetylmuramoyl-pentapeptidetransferase [Vampirovibrio sp.]|jgi:phospho-N-acetylmuramoyl-pentapeptide-transferase|nr:Phospho-N-acetylmuramoyl-pentapeptidetransferase [Vampirovibrio sp.]